MRPLRPFLFLLLVFPLLAHADPVAVRNLRVWQAPDHIRLVFDLSGPLEHRLSTLKDPHRIVIDMDNARLSGALPAVEAGGPLLAGVRSSERSGTGLRIVLDLKTETRPRSFVLKPYGDYGHRLVIDLMDVTAAEDEARPEPTVTRRESPALLPRDLVVAIDAGHGGEDPGAIGRRYRTREKDVTLAIARELAKRVAAAPGMKAVLIRDGDYYIGLRERIKKAHRHQADVFISIHADAVPGKSRTARGASVYALSERGATSEAALVLANKENAADLIGGVDMNDKDDLVRKVLVDMTQTATIGDSLDLGIDLLAALKTVGPLHQETVAQAGFMVLKSPHIPSVLVETAYISNPDEEKKLRDKTYQRQVAEGIFNGLQRAMPRLQARRGVATPSQASGPREHVVKPGETLALIAKQYDIHVEALRFINGLGAKDPPAGRRLRIPSRAGG
jgi:N-acetylmuramoyl-L-alanine amidase